MDTKLRWILPSLVLLAVVSVAATAATDGALLNTVLVVFAIGLLVAGYVSRYRVREQLFYQRDHDDDH